MVVEIFAVLVQDHVVSRAAAENKNELIRGKRRSILKTSKDRPYR